MARMLDYDSHSLEDIYDWYKILYHIGSIEGLLEFPLKDIIVNEKLIEVKAYEKSFWGKNKLVGYLKIEPIDDYKLEDIEPMTGTIAPPYLREVIGYTFSSKYGTYTTNTKTYHLRQANNIIVSYYNLLSSVNVRLGYHKESTTTESYDYNIEEITKFNSDLTMIGSMATIKKMLESLKIFENNE